MKNFLKKIIKQKKEDLIIVKEKISLFTIENKIKSIDNFLDFKKTIINNQGQMKVSLIAEIKKGSPSAGVILKDFDHLKIANLYFNNNATCLSVLTEERFFFGNLNYISEIKKKIEIGIEGFNGFCMQNSILILISVTARRGCPPELLLDWVLSLKSIAR